MQNVRTIQRLEGGLSAGYTLIYGRFSKPYVAGSGAGAAVATVISGLKELPTDYSVIVTLPEDATHWISAKTSAGFTLNVLPRLAANTVVGGNADIIILG